jgi:hypothetical protein
MKNFMKVNIVAVLTISLVLILNTGSSSIYGQNFSNQTSGQNNTQQLGQQLEQANQQLAQANQTQQQVSNQAQQQLSQANQTSGQNNTQQLGQQLEQANQQLAQANQTQQQVSNQAQQQLTNQTQPTQANQTQPTQANQSKQQDPKMNEKLLNFTNTAILALNDDNTSAAQDSLVQIQNELINASGKQVIVIPAPAISTDDSDEGSDE